ncbi:hypothetical protein Bca4012_089259 [Brassica carinata]
MEHSVAPSNPDGELEEPEELREQGQVEELEAVVVKTAVEEAAVEKSSHTEAGNHPHTEAGNPPHTEDSMVEAHTQEAHTEQEAHTPVRMIFPEIGSQGHAPVQIQCRSSKLMGPSDQEMFPHTWGESQLLGS